MKLKLPLIAVFVAVLGMSAGLTACGGSSGSTPSVAVASPATLTKTDSVIGTGPEAVSGKKVTVNYTGWLYVEAGDHKGAQFDTSIGTGKTPFIFTLGTGSVVSGFEQGVTGMKQGGKRVVLIPSNLGYGASGNGPVPPNAGLVFEIELIAVN
jgi:FKBP-type peptidyl-prolyl cis-trans isomerase FkpA